MSFVNVYNIGGSSRPKKVAGSHAAQMLGTLDINIKFVYLKSSTKLESVIAACLLLPLPHQSFLEKTPQPYNIIRQ